MSEPGHDERTMQVVDLAHHHALDAIGCRLSNDVNARHELQRQLDAVGAELDRLRSLPELKLGQRARQFGRLLRRCVHHHGVDPVTGEPTNLAAPPAVGAVVIVRNRCNALMATISMLQRAGIDDIAVIDDASTDPRCMTMLESLDLPVHHLTEPMGWAGPWVTGAMARILSQRPALLICGEAVPKVSCPPDAIDRLLWELNRHPEVGAVGLPIHPVSSGSGIEPAFRLYRPDAGPRAECLELESPYVAEQLRLESDNPSERFARHEELRR